jgi:ATP-binding cassette subfamily C protein LapB
MDSTNEMNFNQMMNQHKNGKTMILISHKNSSLKLTNRLILLDNGKLILDDKFDNVLKQLNQPKTGLSNGS